MKIALVHDYLKEYGGAERVLEALHEIWPKAPIYTAFYHKNSVAGKAFNKAKVIESKFAALIKHKNLYSPLRFLTPLIWKSFNKELSKYDVVISSNSWFICKGVSFVKPKTKNHLPAIATLKALQAGKPKTHIKNFKIINNKKPINHQSSVINHQPLHICYCHTPPRWLYGYPTSVEWQRYWPVKIYGQIIAHFLRLYDFKTAQSVDKFIVNSKNTANRVKKFYRRDSTVIYPPVEVKKIIKAVKGLKPQDYYLIVSRMVGAKGIELAIKAAMKAKVKLKIIGEPSGLRWFGSKIESLRGRGVEFLGRVSDKELFSYYGQCKAFLALAEDEDFGITLVEAMAGGRPVIAFRGGGYLESVIEGKTGVFIDELSVNGLAKCLKSLKAQRFKREDCQKQAKKFSKERFKKEIKEFISKKPPRNFYLQPDFIFNFSSIKKYT